MRTLLGTVSSRWANITAVPLLLWLLSADALVTPSVLLRHQRQGHQCCRRGGALVSRPVGAPVAETKDRCDSSTLENIVRLTRDALIHASWDKGDVHCLEKSLKELANLCQQRLPFDFDQHNNNNNIEDATKGFISYTPALIPVETTERICDRVRALEQQGLLSTNPDSVDGLPSFHLNLVSNGLPLVADTEEFQQCLKELLDLVHPYIYETLLPSVRQQFHSTNIQVGDVFLRRYGPTGMQQQQPRSGISAHFDVLARATTVIALDSTAASGRNGLYTCVEAASSNHAALRRFFPLQCGDAVTHSWNVLHGVDVEPGLERTSLIVWFTEQYDNEDNVVEIGSAGLHLEQQNQSRWQQQTRLPPWLLELPDLETNDIAQFVYSSAMESSNRKGEDDSNVVREFAINGVPKPVDLYIRSASQFNTFALTRLGSVCAEEDLDDTTFDQVLCLAQSLVHKDELYRYLLGERIISLSPSVTLPMDLAKIFWLEAAKRGNPLAQLSMADELMFEASSSTTSKNKDDLQYQTILAAAVLFALAAQQGHELALDSLARVMRYDLEKGHYASVEDFTRRSLVAQVANWACYWL